VIELPLPAGTTVRIEGELGTRYAQRTLRTSFAAVLVTGEAALPVPVRLATGAAGEDTEGRRVGIEGTVVDSPAQLADGTAVTIDDGSGGLRVVVLPARPVPFPCAVIACSPAVRSGSVTAAGPGSPGIGSWSPFQETSRFCPS